MQYNQPYGGAVDTSYIDGIPSIGQEGSVIPFGAVEYPQREIVNFILKSQLAPTNGDLNQLARSVQVDLVNFAIDNGTLNHIVITLDPAPATLVAGLKAFIIVKFTNTGTTDVNCNGIVKPLLTQGLVNLAAGVIVANGFALIIYDGTQWQLMLGTAATAGPAGPTGIQGTTGAAGAAGAAGAIGAIGPQGPPGPTGPAGSPTSLIAPLRGVGTYGISSAGGGIIGGPFNYGGVYGNDSRLIGDLGPGSWRCMGLASWSVLADLNSYGSIGFALFQRVA